MDDVKQVELLLQATYTTKRDFEEFQKGANSQENEKLDKRIGSLSIKTKKLVQNTDSLSARAGDCDKRLGVLNADKMQKGDAEKGTIDLVQAGEILAQLQNILTIRNNPSAMEKMRTPPVTYAMAGFKDRKKSDNVLCTDPFYSHPSGYKMCLKIYFNGLGEGKGTHISVYLMLLPGEFDEILEWPFAGCATIHLVNQRKDKLHHTQLVSLCNASLECREKPNPKECNPQDRPCWGYSKFVPQDDLPAKGMFADKEYLKNDTLVFRVYKVDIYNLRY